MSYNPETNRWEYEYKRPYNPSWAYTANRRKQQRRLNKAMRIMNKNIYNDTLWRGRFYVHSGETQFQRYEDNSGYELVCELIFTDKKTGKTISDYGTVNEWVTYGGNKLFRRMNDFIIEDCKVWNENPNPRCQVNDYRN